MKYLHMSVVIDFFSLHNTAFYKHLPNVQNLEISTFKLNNAIKLEVLFSFYC